MSKSLPEAAPMPRLPQTFPLRDLAVAPENLRAGEPPDAEIPQLAETISAAGLLQPLTVRPGRRREKPVMVLDGRRRWLALTALREAGRIGDDYPVSAFVETDRARQAAAAVLTNTGVPVHVADVIAAIGKMLKARLSVEAIARALGHGELEVRRLAALAGLHPKALEALKAGRITLRQAKLLARLPDREEQGELAQQALDGRGFAEWRVTEVLDRGALTLSDRRFRLVGSARYAEAGGRTEADLFGERPDVLLDPAALHAAWTARAEALAAGLATAGREVRVMVDPVELGEDLEAFGYAYGAGLDADALQAWRAAEAEAAEAREALAGRDLSEAGCDGEIQTFLHARLAALLAAEPARPATLLQVFASSRTGLDLMAYGPAAPDLEEAEDDGEAEPAGDGEPCAAPALRGQAVELRPVAAPSAPEVDGINHALHEVRTDTATRALIRAVADDPRTAMTALVARLFAVLVLRQGLGKGGGALTLTAEAYGRPRTPPIEGLDGDVRRRLAERRAAWETTGLTPIAWVAALPDDQKMGLLAELVALSLDLREERTTAVRRGARADAAEIAALCPADVARHWTPDAPFLAAHPKGQLLAMLEAMGAPDGRAGACKKDELVSLVAARAAERAWVPAWLRWAVERPEEPAPDDEPEAEPPADGAEPLAA